jgi:hypothetical protein
LIADCQLPIADLTRLSASQNPQLAIGNHQGLRQLADFGTPPMIQIGNRQLAIGNR